MFRNKGCRLQAIFDFSDAGLFITSYKKHHYTTYIVTVLSLGDCGDNNEFSMLCSDNL